jgi:hypothetical protein
MIQFKGATYIVSPSLIEGANKEHLLFKDNLDSTSFRCGNETFSISASNQFNYDFRSADSLYFNDTLSIQLAIDTDYETYLFFEKNEDLAVNYILTLASFVSQIYEYEIGIKLEVTFLRIWTTKDDPYSETFESGTLINEFYNHWNDYMQHIDRQITLFFSKRFDPDSNGVSRGWAGAGLLCGKTQYPWVNHAIPGEYSVSSRAIFVVAHEIGHSFNAPHTHDCVWPIGPNNTLGPIDLCGTNCTGVIQDSENGTMMSYCSLDQPYRFNSLTRRLIRAVVESAPCLEGRMVDEYLVSGRVLEGESGVKGVQITASIAGPIIASTVTDDQGRYTLTLPINSYNINARKDGTSIMGPDGANHAYAIVVDDVNNLDFTAIEVNSDIYEYDDGISYSKQIDTEGTIQYRTLHNRLDKDLIQFKAQTEHTYLIKTYPNEDGWSATLDLLSIRLLDSDGITELASSFQQPSLKWVASKNENLFIEVRGPVGPYGISVTDITNVSTSIDTFGQASNSSMDKKGNLRIKIFSNPTTGCINIQIHMPGPKFIVITSLNGQLLYTDRMEGYTHQIDLSSFEKGLYFITVKSRDYARTEKIIKF